MPPVVGSLFFGAVDLLLLLGLAACWRWRDSAGKAGCALGAIIALKLIALPLVHLVRRHAPLACRRAQSWRLPVRSPSPAGP